MQWAGCAVRWMCSALRSQWSVPLASLQCGYIDWKLELLRCPCDCRSLHLLSGNIDLLVSLHHHRHDLRLPPLLRPHGLREGSMRVAASRLVEPLQSRATLRAIQISGCCVFFIFYQAVEWLHAGVITAFLILDASKCEQVL